MPPNPDLPTAAVTLEPQSPLPGSLASCFRSHPCLEPQKCYPSAWSPEFLVPRTEAAQSVHPSCMSGVPCTAPGPRNAAWGFAELGVSSGWREAIPTWWARPHGPLEAASLAQLPGPRSQLMGAADVSRRSRWLCLQSTRWWPRTTPWTPRKPL